METIIRSPQDGVIKKLAHKEGVSSYSLLLYRVFSNIVQDICKAGTVLVQFEEVETKEEGDS